MQHLRNNPDFTALLYKHSDSVPDLRRARIDAVKCVWQNHVALRCEWSWFVAFTPPGDRQRFAVVEGWADRDDSEMFMMPMVPAYNWLPGDPLP